MSVPGHAIVADGYGYQGDTLYVHFNFGWEGSSDAWYNPPDLSQAGSNYTSIQTIIYNIYPQGTPNCMIVSGRMKDASDVVMANATVTAAIVNGNTETPLVAADGGATKFAFANQNGAGIEKVRFNGEGKMESL